jgi:NADH-quinone oxidoreductase subunit C
MELVYDFNKMADGGRIAIRVRLSREKPELPSISKIFGGANWYEREAHEMFGIVFSGHPNLTPLILPEDATFHPLRKDFSA